LREHPQTLGLIAIVIRQENSHAPVSSAKLYWNEIGGGIASPRRAAKDVRAMNGDDDDRDAFAKAMRGVKPLRATPRVGSAPPRPKARRAPTAASEPPTGDPQLLKQLKRRLRRGELAIGAEIDLHGATAAATPALLDAFFMECRAHGVRCARVVHGKGHRSGPGGPVLKGIVHERLTHTPGVLGFVGAEPRDGGSGATLVFLGH
jgi:DNA-nicking Smr family endonuclease